MASLWLCCWLLNVLAWSVCDCRAAYTNASVYLSRSGFQVKPGITDKENAIAYAMYNDTVNENGWRELHIAAGYSAKGEFTDEDVMMAAGVLEGFLSQHEIHTMYMNMYTDTFTGQSEAKVELVKDFYSQQREWAEKMVESEAAVSDYWYYTGLILTQFKGLQLGYKMAAPPDQQLETFAFDFLSGNGDYMDIKNIISDKKLDVTKTSKEELLSLMYKGRCSALIKVLPGFENIYAAHSTWYTYSAMSRIYKHYSFKVSAPGRSMLPATKVMSFSSYPGVLCSMDDFYIMGSGLVLLQTTLVIFKHDVYNLSTTQALLAWHRVRLANWLATSGEQWAQLFGAYNSGTYNNEYMVLDLNKIELNKAINNGSLWVVEQIPGYVESGDQTDILQAGYWPSYNVPFYEHIFYTAGYYDTVKLHGTEFSYQLCSRAKIFRRDQGKVTDMDTMKYLMRYNDYKNDVYSMGNPMNTICCRGDLKAEATASSCYDTKVTGIDTMKYLMRYNDYKNDVYSMGDPMNEICYHRDLKAEPTASGCYDTKITDYNMALQQMAYAENGPTHQGLPAFEWSASGLTAPHLEQPNLFNFTFVMMQPAMP